MTAIQNYVDLYTALRRVAEEERENLRIRFAQLAAWTGSIPEEKITLHSDVAMDGGEELAAPEPVLVEGGWTCASCGHNNTAEVSFCEECGGKRPEAQVAAPMPPEKRLCENGHEMPPEAAFCPRCGKPEKPSAAPRVRLCENGHELPPGAAFCPRCGKPEKPSEEPKRAPVREWPRDAPLRPPSVPSAASLRSVLRNPSCACARTATRYPLRPPSAPGVASLRSVLRNPSCACARTATRCARTPGSAPSVAGPPERNQRP